MTIKTALLLGMTILGASPVAAQTAPSAQAAMPAPTMEQVLREADERFAAFQRDPRRQFVPIQHRLAEHDLLGEYLIHTGSAIFAVPPGCRAGGYVGDTLL